MRTSAGLCLQADVARGEVLLGNAGIETIGRREGRQFSPAEELQRWLMRNYLRRSDVARELGVTRAAITRYLNGSLKSKRIRAWFIERGCPAQFLDAVHAGRKSD